MRYRVCQGDCMASIGRRFGVPWRQLWDDPGNAGLKRLRRNPAVLFAGDVVVVPSQERREESAATTQRHRFRVTRPPLVDFSVQIRRGGEPRAGVGYRLVVAGVEHAGETDAQGW